MNLFGLVLPVIDWQTATEEERKRYNDISDTRMKIHRRWGFGYMGGGIEEYFTTIMKVAADYYRISEKSEEPQPEQPQSEKTETNTATASGVEGVEVVELENGRIAVVGETYEHRATLKAFGGWWNRREQRWEFKPAQAQSVREWLGMGDNAHTEPQSHTESEPQPEPHTEPQSHTESEPQPEPTTEAHTEPQSAQDEPQPEPEPTTEGEKGVTITSDLAGAFAKVAAIVAAVVMVATSSAAQPEPQPETEKGSKIVFSSSDTPDLQEIHTETQTDTRTEPQPEPATAPGGTSDRLDALNLARLKAQSLTEENEHTQALFAELEALAACGVDVADIVRDLQTLDAAHTQRGYITAGEMQMRQFMREFAINRAAARLSDNEFIALFGKGKQAA
jgi:hypothetical protein